MVAVSERTVSPRNRGTGRAGAARDDFPRASPPPRRGQRGQRPTKAALMKRLGHLVPVSTLLPVLAADGSAAASIGFARPTVVPVRGGGRLGQTGRTKTADAKNPAYRP